MLRTREHADDGLISLVKETADGLGRLIADHIKLARVEMVSGAKEYGRDIGLIALAGAFVVIGYVFAWVAATMALATLIGAPVAFLAVGFAHVIGGAVGVWVVANRLKKARLLDETVTEVERSVTTLAAQVTGRPAMLPPQH